MCELCGFGGEKSHGQEVWRQVRVSTDPRAPTAWLVAVLHSPMVDRVPKDNSDRGVECLNLRPEAQTLSSLPAQNLPSSGLWGFPSASPPQFCSRKPTCFSSWKVTRMMPHTVLLGFLPSWLSSDPCLAGGMGRERGLSLETLK